MAILFRACRSRNGCTIFTSMNTIIEGLLSQKPGRDPEVGQVKCFTVEQRTSKAGKPWTKVKNSTPDMGGQPYRILAVNKTDFVDAHKNVSFNVQIESAPQTAYQQAKQTMQDGLESNDVDRGDVPDPILETRQHLMKACNLYNLCVDAVNSAIVPHLPEGARMSADQLQSTLASIWIEASSRRSTDGVSWWSYIDRMPDSPIKKIAKQAAQDRLKPLAKYEDDEEPPF